MDATEIIAAIAGLQSGSSVYVGVAASNFSTTFTLPTGRASPRVVFGRGSNGDVAESMSAAITDGLNKLAALP